MGAMNPILGELNNLSPGAKAALAQAHGAATSTAAMGSPGPTLQSPNPLLAQAVAKPQVSAPPPDVMLPPSAQSQVPSIGQPAPHVQAPLGTSAGDQAKLTSDRTQGAGVSNIAHNIENSSLGQKHPFLGKVLGWGAQVPAMLADTLAESASPIARMALSNVPGTFADHQHVLNQDTKALNTDQTAEKDAAQTANLRDMPELNQAKADLAQSKLEQGQQKIDETTRQHDQQLREHGFKLDETGQVVPLPYAEMSESQQAVQDLKGSQEELADATAALKKVQADPDSPQARMAQQRIETARNNMMIASKRLGLSEDTFAARYHGTDSSGQPLPGALITDDGQPIGSSFSSNVRPTTTARDAAGRAQIGENIRQRILTQLQDPKVREKIGPILGRASNAQEAIGNLPPELSEFKNDLTSYAAFQAGMHPVRGIGALNYFDKVMGGLGQTPEQMMGKLQSNHNTAQDVIKIGQPRTVGSNAVSGDQSAPKVGDIKTFSNGKKGKWDGTGWEAQ
jgi:hypothetical protein